MDVLLIAGPPGSGKDTLAGAISRDLVGGAFTDTFAAPLRTMAADCLRLPDSLVRWLDKNKDVPHPRLQGRTWRQVLIGLSEGFVKPTLGHDYFGQRLVKRLLNFGVDLVVVHDSGFPEEAVPVVRAFPTYLVRLSRRGTTFDGDSRRRWGQADLPADARLRAEWDLDNDGEIEELARRVVHLWAEARR